MRLVASSEPRAGTSLSGVLPAIPDAALALFFLAMSVWPSVFGEKWKM